MALDSSGGRRMAPPRRVPTPPAARLRAALRASSVLASSVLVVICAATLPACGSDPAPETTTARIAPATPPPEPTGLRDVAVVEVRDLGAIRIELLPEVAPRTVANFIELAEQEFYDGTTFHRVIPEFAIQAGDPNSTNRDPRDDGRGGPGYTIEDEFSEVSHRRGIVSMANQGRPNTAGSQFFVVVEDARPLDGKYSVFGQVIEGMDVVDAISRVERDSFGRRGPRDRPLANIVIDRVRIERGVGGVARLRKAEPETGPGDPAAASGELGDAGAGLTHPLPASVPMAPGDETALPAAADSSMP